MKTNQTTSNPALKPIAQWVKHHFVTATKAEQAFNVWAYTPEDKRKAIKELEDAGYLVTFAQNGNSIVVFDVALADLTSPQQAEA